MVDWVLIDSYATGTAPSIGASYGKAYSFMSSTSDATHNYLSKPWGPGEFGVHNATQAQQYAYWDSFKTAVDKATYPQVKAFINFDSPGYEPFSGIRVAYADNGTYDPVEQQHYNAFARDPKLANAGGSGDVTPRQ